jgi:hypothetical protein
MPQSLSLTLGLEADEASFGRVENRLNDLAEHYQTAWSGANESALEDLGAGLDGLSRDISGMWSKTWANAADTTQDAIQGSLSAVLRGEMDEVAGIWESAWQSMGGFLEGLWSDLLGSLASGLSSLLQELTGLDLGGLLDGLLDGLGLGDLLGDLLDGLGLGDLLGGGISDILGGGLSDLLGGGVSDLLGGLTGGISDLLGGLGGGVSDLLGSLTGGVGDLAGGASELLGGLGGGLLGGAGILGGVELFAGLAGIPGPVEGITNAIATIFGFGDDGGFTPEKAQKFIAHDMEHLGRAVSLLGEAMQENQPHAQDFLLQIRDSAAELERLAEYAGYSQEEIDTMVEGLGPWGAAMTEAAQVSALLKEQVGGAVQNFQGMGGEMSHTLESAEMLRHTMDSLVEELAASGVDVEDLSGKVDGLVEDFLLGQIGAEELTKELDEAFVAALSEAGKQGELTAEEMRNLAEAIRDIPTTWSSEIHAHYYEHHHEVDEEERHLGGLVLHGGGVVAPRYHQGSLVTSLAADEVPIIARRGEYVVRAESVNAATLPWLQALNQTGSAAAPAREPAGVSLHVEVHGNLLGSETELEELARLIGGKLRELEASRHRA